MTPNKRNPESGYALLLIFAMAAIVAVTLYSEVPRVAFEAQRDKEQLLVDRGGEYSRAVALFVRKFNRFPATMEELDNTNNQRFLRRRFVDPMTGKADWRLLHAGPGGVITDSVTTAKKTDGSSSPSGFITDMGNLVGGTVATRSDGVNLATRQRPSDQAGSSPTGEIGSNGPGNFMPANPMAGNTNSSAPAGNGPIAGYNGPVMVLPDGRIVPANASGSAPPAPGTQPPTGPGSMPTTPGFPVPGQGGVPGISGQQPTLPSGVAIQQGQPLQPNFPNQPGANVPPGGAAGLINQILTTPRPGGINGVPGQGGGQGGGTVTPQGGATVGGAPSAGGSQQQVIGAGIAGVASKREQEGIKTINDRTKYNEWEFVYDITKDPMKAGQGQARAPGTNGAPGATGQPGQPGQPPQMGQPSPFGNPGGPPFSPGPGPVPTPPPGR